MAEKSFEEALQRLEAIVQRLEAGDLSLDQSLKAFEEGIKLAHFLTRKLGEAEKKVEILLKDKEGLWETKPFTPEPGPGPGPGAGENGTDEA